MKRFFLLIIAMIMTIAINAQNQKCDKQQFSPEAYKTQLKACITEKAGLTEAEAEKFFALYKEMKYKQRDLMKQIIKIKRQKAYNSDKEYKNAVLKIAELTTEMSEIQETYYKKICNIVPAEKLYKAILAEDCFHRDMLKNMKKN